MYLVWSDLSAVIRNAYFPQYGTYIKLQVYNIGVGSFTKGWICKQCDLTNRFPNVFVQELDIAKNRQRLLTGRRFFYYTLNQIMR